MTARFNTQWALSSIFNNTHPELLQSRHCARYLILPRAEGAVLRRILAQVEEVHQARCRAASKAWQYVPFITPYIHLHNDMVCWQGVLFQEAHQVGELD